MSDPGFEYYVPPELPDHQKQAPGQRPDHPRSSGPGPGEPQEQLPMTPGRRMLIITSVLVMVIGLAFILRAYVFNIRFIRVIGIQNITWQQVATSAGISNSSNYFGLREDKIAEGINSNRYLVYERMQKVFPNTVILYVRERLPSASINYIGVSYIMADDGLILSKMQPSQTEGLIRVSGLALRDIREGNLPLSTKEGQVDTCISLIREIYNQGFSEEVSEVNLSEPSLIHLTTRDGFSIRIGDGTYLRAKIGTVRAVLMELRRLGYAGGTIEATVPAVATYRPDKH